MVAAKLVTLRRTNPSEMLLIAGLTQAWSLLLTNICKHRCSGEERDRQSMAADNKPTTEVLAGLVERVTFHNEDNGFCVLRVKARGKREPITVVGRAAVISAGEFIQASGEWANDRTHGVQFPARFLKSMAPTTIEGIEKYLGSGMIRGIGPAYARKLVGTFGSQVFDVIEAEPH